MRHSSKLSCSARRGHAFKISDSDEVSLVLPAALFNRLTFLHPTVKDRASLASVSVQRRVKKIPTAHPPNLISCINSQPRRDPLIVAQRNPARIELGTPLKILVNYSESTPLGRPSILILIQIASVCVLTRNVMTKSNKLNLYQSDQKNTDLTGGGIM